MKRHLLLLLLTLTGLVIHAQVDNYAVRLAPGGNVDCGPMPELNGLDQYTLQLWFYADDWTEGSTLLQRGEGLRLQAGGTNKLLATVGSETFTVTNTFLNAGRWTHVTMLSTGEKLIFYINGNRTKTFSGRYPLPEDGESHLLLGSDTYQGRLDEIRIWNTEITDEFGYFVHTTLNKWVPQLDNLVAYFKCDQELCPNLVDYKPLFDPTAEYNHHGTFSATGATLEKVTDNTGMPYLFNGAYCDNARFYDRAVDRDKYLLSNDLIILGINSYTDGHLRYASTCDHATPTGCQYLSEFEGRQGVVQYTGEGSRLTATETALEPSSKGYTFETWLYLDEWTPGAYLFRKETTDQKHGLSISLGDAEDRTLVVRVNGHRFVNRSKLEPGRWTHLAITTQSGTTVPTALLFLCDGKASYPDASLSDTSADTTPTGMDDCPAILGEGLRGKLDETALWNQNFTAGNLVSHMTAVPFPGIGIKQTASVLANGAAYYRYDQPEQPGYDYFSQDEWRRIMLSAYEGYRGYQVRISVRSHTGWQTTIADASRRKIFAADLARLSEGYDGVELDLEWMDGTQTNLGLLADEILAVLPEGKTLMISCHAYGAYRFPTAKISKVDGFTMQQYGPQNTFTKWSNFQSSYNNFVSYGFPKDKIYLSYSTTTSKGYDASGTATGEVVGVRKGFLERDDYQPDYTADTETWQYNGLTYYFMGPGQVYRRAKFCVDNALMGIFYWDLGNDIPTSHPYSLPKACSYALNSNVDTLVTEVRVQHPDAVRRPSAGADRLTVRLDASGHRLQVAVPSGLSVRQLQLYSPSGQCLARGRGSSLSLRPLPSGVYLLRAQLSDGTTASHSLIKK